MTTYDGNAKAAAKEEQLKAKVDRLDVKPQIGAILFTEDAGSRLYTRLKKEAAERLGMQYHVRELPIWKPLEEIADIIDEYNFNPEITGVIIQKPMRRVWEEEMGDVDISYQEWWEVLVKLIDERKDVDGLHPSSMEAIADGTWKEKGKVLPATCQAVIDILVDYCREVINKKPEEMSGDSALKCLENKKIIILGKSDLLGKPLYYYLHNLHINVEMIGSKELQERVASGVALTDADVVVTATGRHHLITGEMLKEGSAVIDVGEPRPDVEFESVSTKADFVTPVPGGVGPMTVVCLMENGVKLVSN
ncbi:MAG: Methenyltetrahydrofolate cyclohydrolase [Patescibacteria group bacterium]|jgi:methylenetetrahydrofolate dehydrogenase (NADP+)/methenyltetrahydrofolate cyclohydrolase|nr:Methenyltetrahydrofolate cyclohydrolase [Patescibacteria group bacterium]